MALAKHSGPHLRFPSTVESGPFKSLTDVGSFQPPQSNKLAELKYPKGPRSTYRRRDLSSFVALWPSEPTPTARIQPTTHPSETGVFLAAISWVFVPSEHRIWSRLAPLNIAGVWSSSEMGVAKASEEIKLQITEEAQKRLHGHERLFDKLLFITRQEAAARRITLRKIEALGAWSHEYEENNGVVIHVEVQGSDDERFSVWEGISERINLLHDTLFAEEREFLTSEI